MIFFIFTEEREKKEIREIEKKPNSKIVSVENTSS